LLLTTPLHERQIVRGQMLSLWRQFAWPVTAVLLANLTFVLGEFRMWDSSSRLYLLISHLLLGAFLAADMVALSWAGAWLGLINRKPNRAALLALARILVLPAVSIVVILCLWALVSRHNSEGDSLLGIFLALWFWLELVADLYFGFGARAKLRTEFRTIVSEGFKRKQPSEPAARPTQALVEAQ
jgi:hypothetical protein